MKKKNETKIALRDDPMFHSLSPVSDKKNHQHYCDALEWALKNREARDIKNIALTGNYGSGKSSILKTFQERKIENLHFLKISLATFKEEKIIKTTKRESGNIDISNDSITSRTTTRPESTAEIDQQRLIELSILQQIFYHEKHENIPDSRFKKIKSLDRQEVIYTTWLIFGCVCSYYLFFYFDAFRIQLNLPEPKVWFEYLSKGLALTTLMVTFFFLLKKIIHFSLRLTISKLNFQNLEIQVEKNQGKSILNNHLDEILYFFEATNYNVVIIEDLDRFEQTEIFTKLREINLLINNSKLINRNVAFIYAVRDEMFKDNDRTKFFDFIIPVIPIINYSNSNEQLTKALKSFGYSISSELIEEIAFYFDDMRLLYNVVNEFHIYFQKFQGREFLNKLFAMIVYKNIYPEDFVELGRNTGILYKYLVENKTIWIKETLERIEIESLTIQNELEQLQNALPKNLNELKRVYLLEYIKRANNLSNFVIGNVKYDIEAMLEDDNFEKLMQSPVGYDSPYSNNRKFNFQFSEIETEIDSENNYLERKTLIEKKNSGRITDIRNKLKSNKEQTRRLKETKVKYLFKGKKVVIPSNPTKQEQLIILFIRKGYIAEDYLNYISYFYPGSITENDHWFLMNVRNETASDFEYKLEEISNVIKKIGDSEFEKSYVLNYGLVEYLLKSGGFHVKKDILLNQLSNESEESFEFIKSYIEKGCDATLLVKELCKVWVGIWKFFEQDSVLSEEEKLTYYILILNKADVEDIKHIASVSGLVAYISDTPDILTLIEDSEKLKTLIALFNIKFTSLTFEGCSEDIKKYVYTYNNYAINPHMLGLIIKAFGQYDEKLFNTSNYSAIQLSKCELLIKYLDDSVAEYIDSVYLKIDTNRNEPLSYLMDLLNHPTIEMSDKKRVVLWTNTLIKYISELNYSSDLTDFLLQNTKVEANWLNVIFVFKQNENSFTKALLSFMNDQKNAKTLSSEILDSRENFQITFRRRFLENNDVDDELYPSYIGAFPFVYSDLEFETLSKTKVAALVGKRKLSFNVDNYNKLRTNFSSLHLTLAINNISSFFKEFSVLDLSEMELIELLENSYFETSNKIKLIGLFEAENPVTEIKALTLIGNIHLEFPSLRLTEPTLSAILLKSSIKQSKKIELFMRNISLLNVDFVSSFLSSLGGKFEDLNKKGPMPSFRKTNNLVAFFDYLHKIGKISKIKDKDDWIKVTTFRN